MYKRHYQDEEYDPDNYAYVDDDEDYDDLDDYKDVDVDEPEDDFLDDDIPNDETVGFDGEILNMHDLSGGKQNFDPSNYDFDKIMEDYNSGNPVRVEFAKTQAVCAMDALVKHIINHHYPTYRAKHYDDMLQEGRMAIIETLGGYSGKCAPSSYFYTNIRHQIQVFIAESVHRTTRHYAAMANKIRKAELALSQIDGKDSHDDLTISVFTGLPLTTVIETRKQTKAADFVELNTNVDNNAHDVDRGNPEEVLWQKAKIQAVHDAVHRLRPTEAQVICLLYGLDGDPPLNPPAIARKLNLKTEQVRKISQDACRKLSHDKRLIEDLNVQDRLSVEQNRSVSEMPFIDVQFGAGENFFDEISENDDENYEVFCFDDLFKPMIFDDKKDKT